MTAFLCLLPEYHRRRSVRCICRNDGFAVCRGISGKICRWACTDGCLVSGKPCRLEVSIAKQWLESEEDKIVGAQYDFTFYNDSAKDMLNWVMMVKVPAGCRLDSYWSGECNYENDVITIRPLDYNHIVKVSSDISFGFVLMTPNNATFHVEDCAIIFYRESKLWQHPLFWVLIVFLFALLITDLTYAISGIRIRKYNLRQEADRRIIEQSLKTFANVIDAKAEYTKGAFPAGGLLFQRNCPPYEYGRGCLPPVVLHTLLHDIGKIGTTDSILTKPEALTTEERETIKQHVVIGGEILKDFNSIPGIAEGAMYHHERYDGNGYAAGLAGDAVPLFARIICVADSFDAMSSARCYRGKLEMIADGFAPVMNGEAEM